MQMDGAHGANVTFSIAIKRIGVAREHDGDKCIIAIMSMSIGAGNINHVKYLVQVIKSLTYIVKICKSIFPGYY